MEELTLSAALFGSNAVVGIQIAAFGARGGVTTGVGGDAVGSSWACLKPGIRSMSVMASKVSGGRLEWEEGIPRRLLIGPFEKVDSRDGYSRARSKGEGAD